MSDEWGVDQSERDLADWDRNAAHYVGEGDATDPAVSSRPPGPGIPESPSRRRTWRSASRTAAGNSTGSSP